MHRLRQAATRERRAPTFWWFGLLVVTGGSLVWMVHDHSRPGAILLGLLLVAAWGAPLVAFLSLSAPHRAKDASPAPGHGTYSEWMKQARLLGRVLLYHRDNPDLWRELHSTLQIANLDLRDTFRAHPLRDDLERVCQRVREGAIRDVKDWFWQEHRREVQDLQNGFEQALTEGMGEDERLTALQAAVEDAAAMMTRRCMPRMLERERIACALDCAWLAAQTANGHAESISPIKLAAALVVEWIDFSEPWQPALVLHRAVERIRGAQDLPVSAAAAMPPPTSASVVGMEKTSPAESSAGVPRKLRRVRVRVRTGRRHHRRHHSRGPSLVDIFLSFGQWVRYSIRAWMLYR